MMRRSRFALCTLLALIVTAGGIGISSYLYILLRRSERDRVASNLYTSCTVKALEVEAGMLGAITVMYAMKDIAELRPNMTNDVWNGYSGNLIRKGNWSVLSLSRVDAVRKEDAVSWEQSKQVPLRQVENGVLVKAPLNRDLYMPIVNTYPSTANILGLDNYFEASRKEVIDHGLQSRRLSVSKPFDAPNANPLGRRQKAFLLFLPMFVANGRSTGGITEAFFESTIVSERFGSKYTYAFGIQEALLFSDFERCSSCETLTSLRQFSIEDRLLNLQCSVDLTYSSGPTIVVVLGVIISALLPILLMLGLWTLAHRNEAKIDADLWKLKTSLLNNISHELKTPLNAISGILDILKAEHLTTEQEGFVTCARKSADQMAVRVDNLVDYSSLEAGQFTVQIETFPWTDLVTEVISTLSRTDIDAMGTEHARRFSHEDAVPYRTVFTADKRCFRRIFVELLSNAMKYTPPDKDVIWRTKLDTNGLVSEVIDEGIGISADLLPQLGTMFRQGVDISTRRTFGGFGLGLTLVKRYLDFIQGTLEISSASRGGSVFTVRCPCQTSVSVSIDQVPTLIEASNATERPDKILVVDDNGVNLKVLTKMLQHRHVVVATNGREAVQKIQELGDSIGLVLMDISMPVMDGYEATQAIRHAGFKVPVIAVTANAPSDETWRSSGMNEFLQKPLRKDTLSALLQRGYTPDVVLVPALGLALGRVNARGDPGPGPAVAHAGRAAFILALKKLMSYQIICSIELDMIRSTADPSFPRYWYLTVDRECQKDIHLEETANFIETVLEDGRGWAAHGYVFVRLSAQEGSTLRRDRENWVSVFHIRICTDATIGSECGFRGLSCANMELNVIYVNLNRWLYGAKASGLSLVPYRYYLIQHEIGHLLGRKHASCPRDNAPRPIMVQATVANDTCKPNMWPLISE